MYLLFQNHSKVNYSLDSLNLGYLCNRKSDLPSAKARSQNWAKTAHDLNVMVVLNFWILKPLLKILQS